MSATVRPLSVGDPSAVHVRETHLSLLDPRIDADNTGVADVGAKINLARTMLPTVQWNFDQRGSGRIFVPPGLYRLTTPATLTSNMEVAGVGDGTLFLVDANIEGFSATATEVYGLSNWKLRDFKMMAGASTSTATAIGTHAFGAGSGGHGHCVIDNVHIVKTSGGVPVYGFFRDGIVGDFFIECEIYSPLVTGCTRYGMHFMNASNATNVYGGATRDNATGLYVEGVSSPFFFGTTIEGNSVRGADVSLSAPNFIACHFEQTGGIQDLRVEGGDNGAIIGGESSNISIGASVAAHDWLIQSHLCRNTITFGAGCLGGMINGGAVAFMVRNGAPIALNHVRINGVLTSDTPLRETIYTSDHTLTSADIGAVVTMNSASANTVTIPPESSVPWVAGTCIEVYQLGAGQTAISPGAGVSIQSDSSKTKIASQYAHVGLRYRDSDVWELSGSLTT